MATAPPPPAEAGSPPHPRVILDEHPTAAERFVAEHIEPRLGEFREWSTVNTHDALLQYAARRKKITVSSISDANRIFSLNGIVIGGMDTVVTSLVSHQARRVSRSKNLTKRYLDAAEVPTPKGRVLQPDQFSRAVKYMKSLSKPVVVKPSNGRAGKGITTNITREEQLRQAWAKAMSSRSATSDSRYLMIVEAYHPGLDIRAFVVGERVVGALARIPYYVIGDGQTPLGVLADEEKARRKHNSHLAPRTPRVTDEFLAPMGLTRETVVERGKVQFLTPIADAAGGGGLTVDVTDLLSDDLRDLAVDGLWSVPGLSAGGIDLLVPDLSSAKDAVVLEANAYTNIVPFHYPAYGEPRHVAMAIMDHLLDRASR